MLPTLQVGDHVLINKLRYGVRLPFVGGWLLSYDVPHPGDVIVFTNPVDRSQDFVKRVIAVPGEVVEIRDKQVLVNGRPRDAGSAYFVDGQQYIKPSSPRDNFGPTVVPPRQLLVLGDNRDRSYDGRFWGFVDFADVKGKALFLYRSWDGRDHWVRWAPIGDAMESSTNDGRQ